MALHVALWCMLWLSSAWNSGNAQQGIGELISRNKPATQSSIYTHVRVQMPARFANDGNYMQTIGATPATIKCAHTLNTLNPWWKVDLQASYNISQVKIWNRLDCCRDRLVPLVIEVSSDNSNWIQCASLNQLGSVSSGIYTLPCIAKGRYVRLTIRKTTLMNVCEIEVYGVSSAVNGSWGSWGEWSSCAADGTKLSKYRLRECNNPAPADGGENCVGDTREVFICPVHGNWGSWGAWSSCVASGNRFSQQRLRECTNPAPADGGDNCVGDSSEVFICAGEVKEIAAGKPATQSSTYSYSPSVVNVASLANDGIYNTVTHGLRVCAHTQCNVANPWWIVDLQGEYLVDRVKIWNRGDHAGERLNSLVVEVKVTDGSWKQCAALPPGAATTGSVHDLLCRISSSGDQPVRASSVKLSLSNGTPQCLQLCEVEVHGAAVFSN